MRKYALWFWHQMTPVRTPILIRIFAGWMQVGIGLLLVWLCRRFIDYVIWRGDILSESLVLFGVIAVMIALRQLIFYLSSMTEVTQQNTMRQRLFRLILGRRLYTQGNDMHSGDISQRLERDLSAASAITTSVLPGMTVTLVQLVGAFLLMQSIDSVLAWSLLVLTPVIAVCAKYLSSRLKKMTLDIREEESRIQMTIQETAEHELTIKTLQGERTIALRVAQMQAQLKKLVSRRVRFTLISRLLLAFTFSYGYFGAFVYGAIQLKEGLITFGVMTAFLQLVGQIQSPIMTLLGMIPQLIHATASVDRLMEIEKMEQEPDTLIGRQSDASHCHQPDASVERESSPAMGIRLVDVAYEYPDGKGSTLSHFSHDFRPGTSTAIMGETGCGKTTILRLIAGITSPSQGEVFLYEEKTNDSKISGIKMRPHIIYIEQGNTLMSGSIRSNLLLAKPDATDDEIRQALHIATADFVYDLPNGLDTLIGEHATKLSGGQAQRISIARGLLREGSILLLDEISSALDAQTEAELFDRLFKAYPEKTIICVTHRKEVAAILTYKMTI